MTSKVKTNNNNNRTTKALPDCFQHLMCKTLRHLLPSWWPLLCQGLVWYTSWRSPIIVRLLWWNHLQGCPTQGLQPSRACGPGWLWMWPNTKSELYLAHYGMFFVFVSVCVFNVWLKTTLLLPVWPRDAKRLDTPGKEIFYINSIR